MKQLIILILAIFLLSFKSNEEFVLTGNFSKAQSENWIYLVKFKDHFKNADSTRIINGKFKFEGKIETPEVYVLHYSRERMTGAALLFIEPGNINITIDPDDWQNNSKVSGGKANEEYTEFERIRFEKYVKKIWEIDSVINKSKGEQVKILSDSIRSIINQSKQFEYMYIKNNPDSPLSLFLLANNENNLTIDYMEKTLKGMSSKLHNTLIYKNLLENNNEQIKIRENNININSNLVFKDKSIIKEIAKINPNKILYIDFWAVWCGPCLREFSYSNDVLKKIDTQKVQFVNICLYSKVEDWKSIIKEQKLQGQHYLLDSDQSKSLMSEIGFNTVPHYIVVNKQGEIIDFDAPAPSDSKLMKIINQTSE